MYDELIKRLRRCASYDPRFVIQDCEDAADAIEELVDAFETALKDVAKERENHYWIPVTERLPKDRKMVLATVNGVVCVAFYGNYMWEEVETYSIFYPTHWMPLPEPPETEN